MRRLATGVLLGMILLGGGAAAAESSDQARPAEQAQCKRAEINPVTGHVMCIDPLGAPVAPPPEAALPCKAQESRGQWSWGPNCTPAPDM
jgi:hypothetical protein